MTSSFRIQSLALLACLSLLTACVNSINWQNRAPGSIRVLETSLSPGIERAFGERQGHVVIVDLDTGFLLANLAINSPDARSYAPGDTIKPFIALAGLETGKRDPSKLYEYGKYFEFQGHHYIERNPGKRSPINLSQSLVLSSDMYYYDLANDLGIEAIHGFLSQFGFGQKTGNDLTGDLDGILPSPKWKREHFKNGDIRRQNWYPSETLVHGIGQGYFRTTPLQLARAMAALANGGKIYRLHSDSTRSWGDLQASLDLKPENLNIVQNALAGAIEQGDARESFRATNYTVSGMAGSAIVWTTTPKDVPSETRDSSIFVGYAPTTGPKFAIAVVVENGGPGFQSAAPIARAILDQIMDQRPIPGRIDPITENDNQGNPHA